MPDDQSFVDRTTGFFNEHPIAGGLLAASPFGSRIIGALGTLAAIEQRRQTMAQQKALESQLGTIGGMEEEEDPEKGLAGLGGIDRTGFRPEAFKAMGSARQNLTSRAAARAAARARIMESPGSAATTQDIPAHPDAAERAGIVPMPVFREQAPIEAEYPAPRLNPRDVGVTRLPAAPPSDRSGQSAGTAVITPAVPPTMRRPRSEEEMREALGDTEYERLLQATQFKGLPPDLAAVQISAQGKGTPSTIEELDAMLAGLEQQHAALPPEQQKALAGRLQNAKSFAAVAKKNPRALSRATGALENYQSALEKSTTQAQSMAWKKTVFDNHKAEFQQSLARIDQMIKNQNFGMLNQEFDNARAYAAELRKQISEMMLDPTQAPLVPEMQRTYQELQGRLQFLQSRMGEQRNQPLPAPPTGRGPAPPPGTPAPAPIAPTAAPQATHRYNPQTGQIEPIVR